MAMLNNQRVIHMLDLTPDPLSSWCWKRRFRRFHRILRLGASRDESRLLSAGTDAAIILYIGVS